MNKILVQFVLVGCLAVFATLSSAMSITEQREKFFEAEKMLQKNKHQDALTVIADLKNYPLYPLLQYEWLKDNLHEEEKIKSFLSTYQKERTGDLLRSHWLKHLADTQQWSEYLKHYKESSKVELQCYYHLAQYKSGKEEEALKEAVSLWTVPFSQPEECDALFALLQKSSYFSTELIWQRFKLALQKGKRGNVGLARYLIKLLPKSEHSTANLWVQVHNNPRLVLKSGKWNTIDKAGDIFAHGIYRLSRSSFDLAINTWNLEQKNFELSQENIDYVETRFGLVLGYRGEAVSSYHHLSKVKNPNEEARQWRVRSALRVQNWQQVKNSLEVLTKEEKQQEQWRYWQARALEETGEKEKAKQIFEELAKERSYYGFAAADKVKMDYQLNDNPIKATTKDLESLKQQPAFKVVEELMHLGREGEAKRHWWSAIKQREADEIKLAAKLAQEWGDIQTAVFTVAKAKYWDDVNLRFPLVFKDEVKQYAAQQNLDPAIVFGLIRQESVFNIHANSRAGARGLMQIMPATGKHIARELNERWQSANSLFDPDTNLRYGTYYYKKLLNKFDGQVALAAAGYNAGPHRVKRWRPDRAMPMDIWIETIPFDETRKYVSVVLMNTIIYQQRLNRNNLKMTDFMSKVQPS